MKNIKFLTLGLAVMLFLASCEEEAQVYDAGDNIRFENPSSEVQENSAEPIAIPVVYTKGSMTANSVSFTIETNGVEGQDFILESHTDKVVNFAADQFTDEIIIRPIDNATNQEEDVVITLRLSGGNGVTLGWPGPDGNNSTHVLTILDNECPSPLVGAYSHSTVGCQGDGNGNCDGDPFTFDAWNPTINLSFVSCTQDGKYMIDDITMGLYAAYTGNADTKNDAVLVVNGDDITIIEAESADDVYGGDAFFGSGKIKSDGSIDIEWANSWGDQGTTTLTPQ